MLRAFLKAGINEFEISIKFCVFFIPILIFFKKKFFWVIIALFAFLKCKCEKNCKFSNILQKVKSYFLAISINLRVIPIEIPKKYKIEAPYCPTGPRPPGYMCWRTVRQPYAIVDYIPHSGTKNFGYSSCPIHPLSDAKKTLSSTDTMHGKILTTQNIIS